MNTEFNMETNTLWSFKERGDWASHKGDYPGNWSPFVPKNLILRYTSIGDTVLDQFLGSGTTIIETKLLDRRGIGCDINNEAINIAKNRVKNLKGMFEPEIINADATMLNFIKDSTIDLICTHPPYSNIINYSKNNKCDLSLLALDDFYSAINKVAMESLRILKKGKICSVMMGDMRKHGCVVPLGFNVMNIFLQAGFKLKEIIIKEQHNCSSTEYWRKISVQRNFFLLAHEYIFVFIK